MWEDDERIEDQKGEQSGICNVIDVQKGGSVGGKVTGVGWSVIE